MKTQKQNLAAVLGLLLFSSGLTWAGTTEETPTVTRSSGNQLMQNQTHWYEHAAVTVGSVPEVKTQGGSLLVLQPGSILYMEGDSTLHKYQMNAGSLLASATVKISPAALRTEKGLLNVLQTGGDASMVLQVPLQNFKSRESGLDDNAYKALKAAEYPKIEFDLTKETLVPGGTTGSYVMTAKGNLIIAGETQPITLTAEATVNGNKVRLKGTQKIKMSDFKITPPSISILVTSITCTDDIDIHYDITLAPAK